MPVVEVHTKYGGALFDFPEGENIAAWAEGVEAEADFSPVGMMQAVIAWKAAARALQDEKDMAEVRAMLTAEGGPE